MNRPHSRSMRLFWILGIVVLVASTAGALWAVHGKHEGPAGSNAQQPLPGDEKGLVCYGYVDVESGITPLFPLQPGRVTAVKAKENQKVKAGAVLLKLDDELARQQLQEAQAALAAAEVQLAEARELPAQHASKMAQQEEKIKASTSDLAAARNGLERKQELLKIKQVPIQEIRIGEQVVKKLEAALRADQEKLNELKLFKPENQIKLAERNVDAKKALVAKAQYGVDECVLKAPVDGQVLQVLVSEGVVLGPLSTGPAIQFCPDKPRIVRAEVEQEFTGRVSLNQAVVVEDERISKQSWRGKVTRISDWYTQRRITQPDALRIQNDVYTLECIVTLDPNQPPLRLGQRVRVKINKD
jgi:HlyD family secretion protein